MKNMIRQNVYPKAILSDLSAVLRAHTFFSKSPFGDLKKMVSRHKVLVARKEVQQKISKWLPKHRNPV